MLSLSGAYTVKIQFLYLKPQLSVPRDPTNSSKTIVKRVVAVASDTIRTLPPYPVIETIVPEGHIWVEGRKPLASLLDS